MRKRVTILVDPKFFDKLEEGRKREQAKLSKEFGMQFNLSQRKFTAMLATRNFKFDPIKRRKK